MFIHNRLTQHISGIIMPIVRSTDCIKPRVVLAWMCWLRLCGVRTRAERTVCPDSTQPQPAHPDDGHSDARNMLS